MNKIFLANYLSLTEKYDNDLFRYCAHGNEVKVKELLDQNVNIYSTFGDGYKFVPLFIALHSKNETLGNLLLDIYERDLSVLKGSGLKKALVAFPNDQTDELMQHIKYEQSSDSIAVLIKNDNQNVPQLAYLNKTLTSKDDKSLQLQTKLRDKNGECDLNWNMAHELKSDSFLHLAIYYKLNEIFHRLITNEMIDKVILNDLNQNPLHYAIGVQNSYATWTLQDFPAYARWFDDQSYLYHCALAKNVSFCSFMFREMMDFGKSIEEILSLKFPLHYTDPSPHGDENPPLKGNIFHLFAESGCNEFFIKPPRYSFKEEDFMVQATNGMSILHILLLSSELKIKPKVMAIKSLCERYPKLILIKDNCERLPLHITSFVDTHGHNLYREIYELTVKAAGGHENIDF